MTIAYGSFTATTQESATVADTYAADARLLEFDLHYQTDSLGSGGEFMK